MHCVIWYHLYNLKNVENTHGGVLLLVKLRAKSILRILNWAPPQKNPLDGAAGSGHTIWAPPVTTKVKDTCRIMLFRHFWNIQYLIFCPNCSFFHFILQATLLGLICDMYLLVSLPQEIKIFCYNLLVVLIQWYMFFLFVNRVVRQNKLLFHP